MKFFVFSLIVSIAVGAEAVSHSIGTHGLSILRSNLVALQSHLWENIHDPRWNEVSQSDAPGADVALAKEFADFDDKLKAFEKDESWMIGTPVERWWVWKRLNDDRKVVESRYNSFRAFIREQSVVKLPSPRITWIELSESIVNNSTSSISKVTDSMFNFILHGHLFREVLRESDNHVCELQQSKHQLLFNMYETLLLTEMKGYSMMQFSWMVLKIYGKGNFTEEAKIANKKFEERRAILEASLKGTLEGVSRAIWRCDPSKHVEGETYAQITKFLQGYIENEVDMNRDGTCRENCAYYQHSRNYGCFKEQFCSRQPPCDGKIHWCQYVDSDMTICLANKYSNRRYDWVEYENGKVYGKKKYCPRGTTQVDSWWRWGMYHCSYCQCICEDVSEQGDRYISMREIVADIQNNKIITGLRFVKMNRVLHLQISEGTLLPGGLIDTNTVTWREVEPFDTRRARADVDYHQLSLDQRAIDLDDLEGPTGTVLTGVRFRKLGTHLNFEIQSTPFNYETGKLDINKHEWIGNDNTDAAIQNPRTQLKLERPDVPTLSPVPSEIDSKSDQYINIDHSDLNADFAQTTVPFIDIQPVISSIPMPLSGAGIYHKGKKSYGGFIAPKIITYDFTAHIKENKVDSLITPSPQR